MSKRGAWIARASRLLGLFLVFGGLTIPSMSQPIAYDSVYLDFEPLGVEEGLAAGLVLRLAQDTTGYLWMGTSQGLNRYEGYRVKVFRHADNDPYSLPGNEVVSVFVDSRNLLWLWIRKLGYCVFNPRTERAYPISFVVEEPTCEDGQGNLWSFGKDSVWYVAAAKAIPIHSAEPADWSAIRPEQAASRYRGLGLTKAFQIIHGKGDRLWALSNDTVWAYRLNKNIGTAERLLYGCRYSCSG